MTPFYTRSPTTFSGSNNSRYREQILQRLLSSLATWYKICTTCYHLVLDTRLELVRCCHRQILSLLCLPIPPIQHVVAPAPCLLYWAFWNYALASSVKICAERVRADSKIWTYFFSAEDWCSTNKLYPQSLLLYSLLRSKFWSFLSSRLR